MSNRETPYGYDGRALTHGARVELHPATDLWMRGARYGTIKRFSCTHNDRVHVELDKMPGHIFAGSADTFRAID